MSSTGPDEYFLPYYLFSKYPLKTCHMAGTVPGTSDSRWVQYSIFPQGAQGVRPFPGYCKKCYDKDLHTAQLGWSPGMRMTYCVVSGTIPEQEMLTESWKMCKNSPETQNAKGHTGQMEEHIKFYKIVGKCNFRHHYIILFRWSVVGGLEGHETRKASGIYV